MGKNRGKVGEPRFFSFFETSLFPASPVFEAKTGAQGSQDLFSPGFGGARTGPIGIAGNSPLFLASHPLSFSAWCLV